MNNMGNLYGRSKLVVSVLLLLRPIFIEAQTSMTTTTEPTPPPLAGSTTTTTTTTTTATTKPSEPTTNATSPTLEAESTQSSTIAVILTTIETNSPYNLANEPAKIIGIAIGVALLCLLIILGGIALQKHIRHQRIKKEEATPPKDFQNPVQMSTGTSEATV